MRGVATLPNKINGESQHHVVKISVADPGCLSRIPDPTFFHPGSWIPDPNCLHPGSRIRIKEFKYFNPKKWFLSSRKYDPGCSSRIPDPDPDFLPIPDPGVKKAPDPGSGSATLVKKINECSASFNFMWKFFAVYEVGSRDSLKEESRVPAI
jgi:hypothetical protein